MSLESRRRRGGNVELSGVLGSALASSPSASRWAAFQLQGVGGEQGRELNQGDWFLSGVDDCFELCFQTHGFKRDLLVWYGSLKSVFRGLLRKL